MIQLAVLKETAAREQRVAMTPDSVARLVKAKAAVAVQSGAGDAAGFRDESYEAVGARIARDVTDATTGANVVVAIQPESMQLESLPAGSLLIALMRPGQHQPLAEKLAAHGVNAMALELVPRITRAQTMDVLSSQATVAGYKAVLLGAAALGKFLPMLTTAAGNIQPARVFVIGAGVSGLQAIATARRLGGVVTAFDIRPAAREQIASLGATAIGADMATQAAETSGGYARAQTADEALRTTQLVEAHLRDVDLVITTANVPGRKSPMLISAAAVAQMRAGAVIVDLAAENGGNCELTRAGETVHSNGVAIIGPVNLPGSVPFHASQMFSRNLLALLQHLSDKQGALTVDPNDEITGAMLVVHDGKVVK